MVRCSLYHRSPNRRLGLEENRLRVITPEVGDGFGSMLNVYAEEALIRRDEDRQAPGRRRSQSAGGRDEPVRR